MPAPSDKGCRRTRDALVRHSGYIRVELDGREVEAESLTPEVRQVEQLNSAREVAECSVGSVVFVAPLSAMLRNWSDPCSATPHEMQKQDYDSDDDEDVDEGAEVEGEKA